MRLSWLRSTLASLIIALSSTAHAEFSFPGTSPTGDPPSLDPRCEVLSVEGPSFEYWVSYSGPYVGPGIPFDFFACPFGRTILHPIFCLDVTMICPKAEAPHTERLCFHAGGSPDGSLQIFPSDYRKPKSDRGTFSVPGAPSGISVEGFLHFWEWYTARSQDSFGGRNYCAWGSGDNDSLNCGSYFLLLVAKLFGKTPAEIRAMIPQLGPCTHFSWDLYEPQFIEDLTPLLLMPNPSGPPGPVVTPAECLAITELSTAQIFSTLDSGLKLR